MGNSNIRNRKRRMATVDDDFASDDDLEAPMPMASGNEV
jgi:hypothetical protein